MFPSGSADRLVADITIPARRATTIPHLTRQPQQLPKNHRKLHNWPWAGSLRSPAMCKPSGGQQQTNIFVEVWIIYPIRESFISTSLYITSSILRGSLPMSDCKLFRGIMSLPSMGIHVYLGRGIFATMPLPLPTTSSTRSWGNPLDPPLTLTGTKQQK